jgi:hypothetical protein
MIHLVILFHTLMQIHQFLALYVRLHTIKQWQLRIKVYFQTGDSRDTMMTPLHDWILSH